jgi:8-oxo-dGTP diphosphatase
MDWSDCLLAERGLARSYVLALTRLGHRVTVLSILEKLRNPVPTVDTIIEVSGGIVLIERRYPPLGWALPGGFVEYGETVAAAAVREAREETGLDVTLTRLFGVYSDPRRDPRRHTIAIVFIGVASGVPAGGDDAAAARVFDTHSLPSPLAFDHAQILDDYFAYKRTGQLPRHDH